MAAILKRRAALAPEAFVFGSTHGAYREPDTRDGPAA
jgi:hypothetical protein